MIYETPRSEYAFSLTLGLWTLVTRGGTELNSTLFRQFGFAILLVASLLSVVPIEASAQSAESSGGKATATTARATLDKYCVTCHNQRAKIGGLVLEGVDLMKVADQVPLWEKVVRKLRAGVMPPIGRPRPDGVAYEGLVSMLERQLDQAAAANPNPGRTEAFHRLNRAEYRNVIRDLFGLETDVTELLPADDASYGFDNMAGVLKVSQSLLERYLGAARTISRAAVGTPPNAPIVSTYKVPSDRLQYANVEGLPLGTRGGVLIDQFVPQDGEYAVKVQLTCGPPTGIGVCDGSGGFDDPHRLQLLVDGELSKEWTLEPVAPGTLSKEKWETRIWLKGGRRKVGATFVELSTYEETEGYRQRFQVPLYRSVSLGIDSQIYYQPSVYTVTITGPYNLGNTADTESRQRIFACHPKTASEEVPCAKQILGKLARRAYRRPVTDADIQSLLAFYEEGRADDAGFEGGVETALRRLLVSPEFLFRIERDPASVAPGRNYRISDLELASRLSFFLWSSLPDEELLTLAEQGKLRQPKVLEGQVRRLLADQRSEALTKNFVGQWLQLRNLDAKRPSDALFPNFDDSLRQSLRQETEMFFDSIVRENRSVLDLLSANYTFLNERLAMHYGIPHIKGNHFRRVTFTDDRRRGLLGQGSILLVTSHAIRTSPVLRGKWILENVLGTPPPPPPPNVPPLPENKGGIKKVLTIREKMAEHRKNPVCANCHSMIDPVGFALENFDAVGQWRDRDEAFTAIDASGLMPDGAKFDGIVGFRAALLRRGDGFVNLVTEKMLTYSLGRGLEPYDMPTVRTITRGVAAQKYRFSSLILGIVNSSTFQMRRSAS